MSDTGNFKFERIGSEYASNVPVYALRLVPAVCGSLLVPAVYYLVLELGCLQWTAALAAFLVLTGKSNPEQLHYRNDCIR